MSSTKRQQGNNNNNNRNSNTNSRSNSNHTNQNGRGRGSGGGLQRGGTLQRGGGGNKGGGTTTSGDNTTSTNNNNTNAKQDNNNVTSSTTSTPASLQQPQQPFVFQHHHQHQPFFQHPLVGGGNSSTSNNGSNANTAPSSSHHHHHHHHHQGMYNAHHQHQQQQMMMSGGNGSNNGNNNTPSYLSGGGGGGNPSPISYPPPNMHHHHHQQQYYFPAPSVVNSHHHHHQSSNMPPSPHHHHHHHHHSFYNNSGNPSPNPALPSSNSSSMTNNNNPSSHHSSPIVPPPGSLPQNVAGQSGPSSATNNNVSGQNGTTGNNNLLPPGNAMNQPSPTYILNTANRDGETQVFDFKNRPIDPSTTGHLATFLNSISPSVSTSESVYGDGSDGETYYLVKEMLLAFRAPFGVPVQMGEFGVSLSESHPPEKELYYNPQLSGFKFEIRTPEPPPINIQLAVPAGSSKKGSKNASKTGTPTTSMNGGNFAFPSIKKVKPEIIEWHEDSKPEMRGPLVNQFEYLCSLPQYERLRTLKNTECTVTSWFCVLWVPIHVKTHTPQASAGSFLVFYLVNPPANMPNSGYRKHDATTFYFRADPFSVAPLEFLNAPSFSRGVDAFAPMKAERELIPLSSVTGSLSEEKLEELSQKLANSKKEKNNNSNATNSKKKNNNIGNAYDNDDDEEEEEEEEKVEVIIDPPVKMRVPIFGLIPCRISAEIWYGRYQYYAPQTGQIINCYAAPLFLLYTAMQLMNWEKSRVIQTHLDEGKNIMEANHLSVILPDYDHLMRHEIRLNAFLNNYVV